MTTTPTTTPNVPLPTQARRHRGRNLDDGNALVTVETAGDQWRDGRVDRHINVTGRLATLTTAEVRAIAADLFAAADDLDRFGLPGGAYHHARRIRHDFFSL